VVRSLVGSFDKYARRMFLLGLAIVLGLSLLVALLNRGLTHAYFVFWVLTMFLVLLTGVVWLGRVVLAMLLARSSRPTASRR